jgi:transposase
MADLLGEDCRLVQKDTLYRCHDLVVAHKEDLFRHLKARWGELFKASFDILLYDLTSTYFESSPPSADSNSLKRYGYSRDKRSDCVQVVVALIVTPEGFPLAYEVMKGNTADKTTLREFLTKITDLHGKANRVWVMDRGIPTEAVLAEMRESDPPVSYLVGTPKGRLTKLEKSFLEQPWEQAREAVTVKLLAQDEEVYVLARSDARVQKERSMRRRLQRQYYERLKELQEMTITRDALLQKLGAAKAKASRAAKLFSVIVPTLQEWEAGHRLSFTIDRKAIQQLARREGAYLLRSNLTGESPAVLWERYIQLTEVEQAFKELKNDLSLRPIYHQKDSRIEAHIFIAFMAYCISVTLKNQLKARASGITTRSALEKFATVQMLDVNVPTDSGKVLSMSRYTQPSKDLQLLLAMLNLTLPNQSPPRISAAQQPTYH